MKRNLKETDTKFGETSPHLLLIDDDPIFRAMVEKRAAQRGIHVTGCRSLKELKPMIVQRLFDAAIVDYFLDDLSERLKGTDVAQALEGTPIILTSATNAVVDFNDPWAASVRKFVGKKDGIDRLLDEALKLSRKSKNTETKEVAL